MGTLFAGSGSRARTCDKWINSPLLCQLSYPGMSTGEVIASANGNNDLFDGERLRRQR